MLGRRKRQAEYLRAGLMAHGGFSPRCRKAPGPGDDLQQMAAWIVASNHAECRGTGTRTVARAPAQRRDARRTRGWPWAAVRRDVHISRPALAQLQLRGASGRGSLARRCAGFGARMRRPLPRLRTRQASHALAIAKDWMVRGLARDVSRIAIRCRAPEQVAPKRIATRPRGPQLARGRGAAAA